MRERSVNLSYKEEDKITLKEFTFDLDLSFNNVLSVLEVLGDKLLDFEGRVNTALYLLIDKETDLIGLDIKERAELLRKVFEEHIGKEEQHVRYDISGNPMPTKKQDQAYSFKHDGELIFASFMQAYKINLFEQHHKLHWKEFKALLSGLPEDTIFRRVVNIRTEELPTGKGTEERRKKLQELKQVYALPREELDSES